LGKSKLAASYQKTILSVVRAGDEMALKDGARRAKSPGSGKVGRPPKSSGAGRPKLSADTPDADETIREAALALFSERGFAAVTTKDIAVATGLNSALIYYYFGSKEDLFRNAVTLAIERAFDRFRIVREASEKPGDIIHGWLRTHVLEFDTIAKFVKISIDYSKTAKRSARLDQAINRFYDEERQVLCDSLTAGIKSGEFRQVDVNSTATFISTYLDGVCVRSMMQKKFDAKSAIKELQTFLDFHLSPA